MLSVSRTSDSELMYEGVTADSYRAESVVRVEVNGSVYEAWIGPRLRWEKDRFSFSLMPHATLGYVELEVNRSESLTAAHDDSTNESLRQWTDRGRTSDWVYGLGALGSLELAFGSWFLAAAGGYDWIAGSVDMQVGPSIFIPLHLSIGRDHSRLVGYIVNRN